jgi:hypothetical protein
MSFAAFPPLDMKFQIQRRLYEGNNSDWVGVKIYYPFPNSIRVQANGVTIPPISLLANNGEGPLNVSRCGSNKFFYQNYTIHFIVTGDVNCQVRVTLTNSIQLTARFAMDIGDFFNKDGQTKFIDRMCALLGITDISRVKVVGVLSGSTAVTAYIDEAAAAPG